MRAVVKAANTLGAAVLASDPEEGGGQRVIFLSGDDVDAKTEVISLFEDAGFFTIDLGGLITRRRHATDRRAALRGEPDTARMTLSPLEVPRLEQLISRDVSVARGLLDRDDLLQLLDRAVTKRVTVISAPPGSGKTSLLRAWADRSTNLRRVAFVSVDRDQQNAQRFWCAVLGRDPQPGALDRS